METKFVQTRITELRLARHISERKMSIDLGHSTSYIRNISSGRALPSINELIFICEYLDVTLKEFFDEESVLSPIKQKACNQIKQLPDEDVDMVVEFLNFIERSRQQGGK